MKEKYVAPEFEADAFHCPHCAAYAHQEWYFSLEVRTEGNPYTTRKIEDLHMSFCQRCEQYALWHTTDISIEGKMIYPASSIAPLPTEDMPDNIKDDFSEARNIVNASPRAAAALLRLALQKLMPHLEEKGKNINDDIASLVAKGLPVRIQQALDAVRVIGNEAVHPGVMNLKDDEKTAIALFDLLNVIVEVMITRLKEIDQIYATLPDTKKNAIKKRDNKT